MARALQQPANLERIIRQPRTQLAVEARAAVDDEYRLDWLVYHRRVMEAAEIKNGRLAMLAITVYALEEAITKNPVVQNSAFVQAIVSTSPIALMVLLFLLEREVPTRRAIAGAIIGITGVATLCLLRAA